MDTWAAFMPSWGLAGQSMLGLTPCLLMVSAGGFKTFFSIILGVAIQNKSYRSINLENTRRAGEPHGPCPQIPMAYWEMKLKL